MQFLQGLLISALGFCILVFRVRIKDFVGNISMAERYLGPGGTWTFLIIMGIGFFVFGLMWGLGTLQNFMQNTFGPLLG